MVKINVSINPELLDKVDSYCTAKGITRSGLISVLLEQRLEYSTAISNLGILARSVENISRREQINQDDINHLIELSDLFQNSFARARG